MRIGTTTRTLDGTAEVAVLVSGTPQPLYQSRDGALWTAGTPGQAYTLRVRNLTPGRVEVITAVDGRNTLKDEPGDHRQNRGLIITGTGEFTGWRVSDDETREFIFGAPDGSVAAQATGSTSNVGVIGFAVYRERRSFPAATYTPNYGNFRGGVIPVASASPVTRGMSLGDGAATMDWAGDDTPRGLGTGIGEARQDHVGRTSFDRASGEPSIVVIGYDTREALDAMGITGPAGPNAFPGIGTGYERYASQS